jgi:hypothetical protein
MAPALGVGDAQFWIVALVRVAVALRFSVRSTKFRPAFNAQRT